MARGCGRRNLWTRYECIMICARDRGIKRGGRNCFVLLVCFKVLNLPRLAKDKPQGMIIIRFVSLHAGHSFSMNLSTGARYVAVPVPQDEEGGEAAEGLINDFVAGNPPQSNGAAGEGSCSDGHGGGMGTHHRTRPRL